MENKPELQCGLIMPIAPMFDYTAEHWLDVKGIITQAVSQVNDFKFKTDIVSNSDGEIDVIHKRIVQNLYNADIVVCDISGRNPNVLFELGMRLTFDKPTIIIKDDDTDFIFDTGLIEHLTYPKDLRFSKIVKFQSDLANAVSQTYKKSKEDPTYSTFLGNFGEFKVPALQQTQVSDVQQLILDEISNIRREVNSIKKTPINSSFNENKDTFQRVAGLVHAYIDFSEDDFTPNSLINNKRFRHYMETNGVEITERNAFYIMDILKSYEKTLSKA